MRIILLENQIDIILKSLENYITISSENKQLIYATYESLLAQKVDILSKNERNTNVTLNFKKTIYKE